MDVVLFAVEPAVYVGLLTGAAMFLLGDVLGVLTKCDWRFCHRCWNGVLGRLLRRRAGR